MLMETPSVFDRTMLYLDKIDSQLKKGHITKNHYNEQRLVILIDLVIEHKKFFKIESSK